MQRSRTVWSYPWGEQVVEGVFMSVLSNHGFLLTVFFIIIFILGLLLLHLLYSFFLSIICLSDVLV